MLELYRRKPGKVADRSGGFVSHERLWRQQAAALHLFVEGMEVKI